MSVLYFCGYYVMPVDSSFVPPLIDSVLGSSRNIGIGPLSLASLVMGTMLNDEVSFTEERDLYVKVVFTFTSFAGFFKLH